MNSFDNTLVESCVNLTPGFSGADISNICNEAAIIGIRNNRDKIIGDDVNSAIDYVMLGNEKNIKLSEKEETLIAYHEAGHALISFLLDSLPNPVKVSIIPRENGALGFSQSEAGSEVLYSKQMIEDQIKVLMAGRICEQVFLSNDQITNGASDDINKATELAKKYVRSFGMVENNLFLNFEEGNDKFFSDFGLKIRDELDAETIKLINNMYISTKNLILSNKESIEKIKEMLINKKTIYSKDMQLLCQDAILN
jgi:ATP-dependent Zn protease